MRALIISTALLLAFNACNRVASPEDAGANGVRFALGSTFNDSVLAVCDSIEVHGVYQDSTRQDEYLCLKEVYKDSFVHLENFVVGKPMALQASIWTRDRSVRYIIDFREVTDSVAQAIMVTRVPVTVTQPSRTSLSTDTLAVVHDVSIDPQGYNLGYTPSARLCYGEALALFDFGELRSRLANKTVSRATLEVGAWMGLLKGTDTLSSVLLDVGVIDSGWSEGTGNWYWFNQKEQNGYAAAFANFPNYQANPSSENPSFAIGLRWANSQALRQTFVAQDTVRVKVAYNRTTAIPSLAKSTLLRIDVSAAFKAMKTGNKTLGLRLRGVPDGLYSHSLFFHTRESDVSNGLTGYGARLILK